MTAKKEKSKAKGKPNGKASGAKTHSQIERDVRAAADSAAMRSGKKKERVTRPTQEIAREFLIGKLMSAALARINALPDPWKLLKKSEQEFHLKMLREECTSAVREVVKVIAGDNRTSFTCTLDAVSFKADGVKASLSMLNEGFAHDLADAAGASVMIVIEDGKRYLSLDGIPQPEEDQKVLFDGLPPADSSKPAPKSAPPKPPEGGPVDDPSFG